MNKSRTIEGRWWIHGDDKPAHFGVLTYDPEKGLTLSVKIPQSRSVDETFLAFVKQQQPQVPNVIHGADEKDKPVTLFGCYCPGSGMSQGLETYQISSMAALLDWKADSLREAKFVSAGVEYSLLHFWMGTGRKQLKSVTSTDGKPAITVENLPDVLFELAPGVRLRIEATFTPSWNMDGMAYRFGNRVWFQFAEPRSIEEIHKSYVGVFLRLLCLLTGTRVFTESLQFIDDDPWAPTQPKFNYCHLLQSCDGVTTADRDRHNMIASYPEIAGQFEDVVRRWFACDQELGPVLDLYLNVTSNPMTAEVHFLLLAQALEVFHGRSGKFTTAELPKDQHKQRIGAVVNSAPTELQPWLKERLAFSNQKTLAQRIDDLIQANGVEVQKLTAGIPDFAAKVRHTRNYYTHYTEELREKGKVAEGLELIKLGSILEDLLEICLLKEIGIEGKAIARILNRSKDMTFVQLDPDETPSANVAENHG